MDEDHEAAFRQLYERHYGAVLAFVLRRHPREEAEDVVQETFLVAWRRFTELPEPPLPWLYGTARNVLANRRRGEARAEALEKRLASLHLGVAGGPAGRAGEAEGVRQALARLSDGDREILTLIAWEGLSPAEAATVLRCSGAAARVRLYRARRRLARALDEAETESGDEFGAGVRPAHKEGT